MQHIISSSLWWKQLEFYDCHLVFKDIQINSKATFCFLAKGILAVQEQPEPQEETPESENQED